jgi:photosystem II stability/assembly factor-like uncharacterized protein
MACIHPLSFLIHLSKSSPRLTSHHPFILPVLLSLFFFPLTACGNSLLGTNRSAPPPDHTCQASSTSPTNIDHTYLSTLSMQNEMTGWGQNYTQKGGVPSGVPTAEQTILHTADGGCHWKIVKSWKYSMEPSPDFSPFFPSPSMAIIYVNGDLFLTHDAGTSWSSITLPVVTQQKAIPGPIFFLNDHLGWMAVSGIAAGTFQENDLLHTTDGGRSWSRLHATLPAPLLARTRSPGYITSLSFLNETTGWATGMSTSRENSWIYLTRDGGTTWQEQHLPSPQGYSSTRLLDLGQPHFFSARDGVLPAASTHFDPTGVCAFITHDSGHSWHSQPFFALKHYSDEVVDPHLLIDVSVPLPSFTSPTTGWVGTISIYRTTDGGRSWHHFDHPLPLHYGDPGLEFITDRVAFALVHTGQAINFQYPTELYRTTDGGKTWTTLRYSIS